MATEVKLPRLGQGMESGTIVRWLKAEGDNVKKREPLYELDTDKVTQEVESDYDGVLLKIVVSEGEVEVGSTIAMIENGDAAASTAEAPAVAEAEAPEAARADAASRLTAEPLPRRAANGRTREPPRHDRSGRIKASPLARRIARERGVDLAALAGTGPDGRIVADDVENAPVGGAPAAAPPAARRAGRAPEADVEVVTMTGTRRTIARRLTEAWAAPVFQLGVSIDMTEALHLREQIVERLGEGDVKPTVNDLLTQVRRRRARPSPRHQRDLHRRRDPPPPERPRRPRGRCSERPRRARDSRRRPEQRAGDRPRPRRDRRQGPRRKAHARGHGGRHVHDLEPRHVRRRAVRRGAQPAAGRDSRGRRREADADRRRR